MRSLLPVADEMEEPDPEESGFDGMDEEGQFEEEGYEP